MMFGGLGRLEGLQLLQPSSAGCAGLQLCGKLRCQYCHREPLRAPSSSSSAARTCVLPWADPSGNANVQQGKEVPALPHRLAAPLALEMLTPKP